ncbi:glycoside hydrolase family 3 C-terminal domain-containing protein [Arsenicicoccus piscis]|uniref:Glycosyl hydrolase n=1 Tax=Arsenicicoccus piscis TaxID=673954 RepID=A0ABQ6HPH0_9MICO|nr:glycoside hydrolase family 3 C-terminal domain-containing protein [Arsenicicoccus piscis]MCH8628607.1 glycoside hydrolase family 3 C-terminal domain-containing protein [Arsenicicoccus piscis]GMA19470.1 glycosyl hydrolase [Arsenicicoccus piscis]
MTGLDTPDLLAQLSLEEKAALTSGLDFWHTVPVDRLGIPSVMVADGPHGLRKQGSQADHVGIGGSNPATCFPPAVGLASSWNRALVRRVGEALGHEGRAEELAVILGPGINIKRSPLCGRNFEYLSEDPLVAGELAVAMVGGIQSQGVGTSVKHYAVNNQETDRLRVNAVVDERTLREIYLPAFERTVKQAKPWTVMASYNKVNGEWVSQDPWLLTEVLRDEWGYEGMTVSDWGAVVDRVKGLAAGLDLEMPGHQDKTPAEVVAAVREGRLDEADLDRAVGRVLDLISRAMTEQAEPAAPVDHDTQHAIAKAAALESIVLLRNESRGSTTSSARPLLPLDPAASERLLVVGELARTPRYQGAGSSQVNPTQVSDALSALQRTVGDRLTFAAGYDVALDEATDHALLDEAVAAAADADVLVVFAGLPSRYESEGYDRTHLDLPPNQRALIDAMADLDKPTVVVLSNGSAVTLAGWHDRVDAVVEGWLLGQAGGEALADVLLGVVNPSGKLTETLPLALEDNPSFGNFPGALGEVRYGEGVFVGYRGYDTRHQAVAYPFGHGLSYTRYDYTNLDVRVIDPDATAETEEAVLVAVTVTNVGDVDGSEIVQLYVGDPQSAVARPVHELRGFSKESLEVGHSHRVRFTLSGRDLSYWHPAERRWFLEPGAFVIEVGASARDIRGTATIEITGGDRATTHLTSASTYEEWHDDPVGGPLLAEHFERHGKTMVEPEVIGNFPLDRLAAFEGMSLSTEQLADLVADLRARSDQR